MAILITPAGVSKQGAEDVERLERVVADLRRIIHGEAPTRGELRAAPLVDRWSLATLPVSCLTGELHDHPILAGPRVSSSEVFAWAPELGWARTLSRFYRLGERRGSEDPF